MRILHTVAPAEFGGLEEVVVQLCGGLRERGHEVTVAGIVDSSSSRSAFMGALESRGVRTELAVLPGRRYGREVSEIRRICEVSGAEVVHTHGYRPSVIHARAARGMGLPLVATMHGFTGGSLRNRLYERLQVRSVRSFDAVVAVSSPLADRLRREGVPARVLRVIRNAWEPRYDLEPAHAARRALGVPPDRFHIGWVGRLSPEKGAHLLLRAIGLLPSPHEVTTSVFGDGPLRGDLERLATRHGDWRFHGVVPTAGRLFQAFDVLVLSSHTEGTPIVLFEAMFASVPIVATAVGGVPDVLTPDCAFLVEPGDPTALAEAIDQVRASPSRAAAGAAQARRILSDRFAPEPWLARHEDLYRSITGS